MSKEFCYTDTRFADIQLLRYRLKDFDKLSIQQKKLVYFLSEAALWGRDITFDQFGKYNLRIRKMLEVVFVSYHGDRSTEEFLALETYLKRVSIIITDARSSRPALRTRFSGKWSMRWAIRSLWTI